MPNRSTAGVWCGPAEDRQGKDLEGGKKTVLVQHRVRAYSSESLLHRHSCGFFLLRPNTAIHMHNKFVCAFPAFKLFRVCETHNQPHTPNTRISCV
jgi:hypothetical protein